jgi:secreted trypsin-like serine protease
MDAILFIAKIIKNLNFMRSILSLLLATGMLASTNVSAQSQYWVVGGQNAAEGQLPWVGDMRVANSHYCGSSLIAPQWVLTAGHCAHNFSNQILDTSAIKFRFNTVSTEGILNPSGGVEVGVKKIYVYPNFSMQNFSGADLCLMQLSEPITSITPIQVVPPTDTAIAYQAGTIVNVAGWGIADTAMQVTQPDTMKWGTSKVYVGPTCNVEPSDFCIGWMAEDSTQYRTGAAAGDSGGPAWINMGGSNKLTGVVSGGDSQTTLTDKPGYFVKVGQFKHWIDSIMNINPTGVVDLNWNYGDIKIGMDGDVAKIYLDQLDAEVINFDVYNMEGRKISNSTINLYKQSVYTYSMNSLAVGTYVMRFYNPKTAQYLSKKVVKLY